MFTLLSWLWNRASRVYEIFGTLYGAIRNAAKYAWSWAWNAAQDALKKAKAWAQLLVTVAKVILRAIIDAAVGFLKGLIDNAVALALTLYTLAKVFARLVVDAAIRPILDLIARVNAEILRVKNEIGIWITDKINAAVNTFIELLLPLILSQDEIEDLLAIFDDGFLSVLLDFYERLYLFLSNLKERPLAFILGMLQGVVLTFLSWVTAYALGTTKYRLPPWPSWDEMEIPGPSGPTPGVPSGVGGLARPLSNLYISGHRFREGHKGTDFGLVNGQAVFAAHDARVEAIGSGSTGYGNWLTLRSDTWWTRYAHLEQVTVSQGQRVDSGQQIARGNSTGNSSGPHLHFEVKLRGTFVDPVKVLNL